MTLHPWEPDRLLTLETAAAVIGTCFPTIDARGLTHVGSGWEFDAFRTSDGWLFRFPRRAHCADLFEPERRVHALVSSHLPAGIAVPRAELMGQPSAGFPYCVAGHRFIEGVAADAVDPHLMTILAREIGTAFGATHGIPEKEARAAGVAEMDVDDAGRREWLERGLTVASDLRVLDPAVDQGVSWVRKASLAHHRFEGQLRFIHHDMSPDHLIVDPTTGRLTGILDWTDAILGDPARDFVTLVTWRGWEFTEAVFRSYPHSIDRAFRERLDFMARLLSVMWLANAYEERSDMAKHVEWVRNAYARG